MKKLLFVAIAALCLFTSCHDSDWSWNFEGDIYFSLSYSGEEPSYVDAGGVVPNNFLWDTYYMTREGFYTIHYEYVRSHRYSDVIIPYDIEIEVSIDDTDYHRGSNSEKDLFFDLTLMGDHFDYTHEFVRDILKSAPIESRKLVNQGIEKQGNFLVKYSIYQLPEHVIEK